ncbi:hypothetical protein HDV63DRAFT_133390 [Trichoderma sp. SZMC 28014]
MNHQSKGIPMEIFSLITAESSVEVLKNLRLTCSAGREIATPLLFQCFRVQAINHHTVTRLREMARHPQLACLVKRFEYNPRIRRSSQNDDECQQLREQNDLFHTSHLLIGDFVAALKSFTQLRHIELQYPPFGMRSECNAQCLYVLTRVIQDIFNRLRPCDGITTVVALPPIGRLDLEFHPGDMPSGEMANNEMILGYPLKKLQWMLNAVPNLTCLRIAFHLLDRSMRFLDWSGLQCMRLNTLELVQLEMPGTSLAKIMTQNAHSIRKVILESVYLLDGTWAAVYDSIARTKEIIDISGIHGRKYPEDRDSIDTELDAASYRRLFAVVEKRRESQGLPSMKRPISAAGFVYHRDFSYMETG